MRLYDIYCKPSADGDQRSVWTIMENESKTLIMETSKEKTARRVVKNLNRGGGFGGLTPQFFGVLRDRETTF